MDKRVGSVKEAKYLVYFSFEQGYLLENDKEALLNHAEELSKLLWSKIKTLRTSNK